jgi:hypothetical protein
MNSGFPPTDLNARTGEFTPPGINLTALRYNSSEIAIFIIEPSQNICYSVMPSLSYISPHGIFASMMESPCHRVTEARGEGNISERSAFATLPDIRFNSLPL